MFGLTAIPWKLIGIGIAALALALFVWRINAWHNGYKERDKAVADLAAYGEAVKAKEARMSKDRAEDESRRAALSLRLANVSTELESLRLNPPKASVVYREKPAKNGVCDNPRIGPDWFGVYNQAADTASRAVSATN